MCGIGGVFCKNFSRETLLKHLNNINNLQNHRGPDNSKIWIDKDLNFGLCHSRSQLLILIIALTSLLKQKIM